MRNASVHLNTILNSDTYIPKRTALKLEMWQKVWQKLHKSLVYPLKSETVVKLKLKKITISAFFIVLLLKIGSGNSLLSFLKASWALLMDFGLSERNQSRCTLSCNRRFSTVIIRQLSVERVNHSCPPFLRSLFWCGILAIRVACICSQCYCFAQDWWFSPWTPGLDCVPAGCTHS